LARRGQQCGCIRCHEIKAHTVQPDDLILQNHSYDTDLTCEHFLHFVTHTRSRQPGLIAGFLRLSLPLRPGVGSRAFLDEIAESALIREVHVYGPALALGRDSEGQAQHAGLGTRLIAEARRISREAGFQHISVIAATGTRAYYAARGFAQGELYMNGEV
jgi:elongator complex protein 3